jgi:DNA-binding GntR family transcriptional regulator
MRLWDNLGVGSDPLDEDVSAREVEELYPAVLMLEASAVSHAPPYDAAAIARMREANAQLLAAQDADAGARADDLFHQHMTENCGNQDLIDVVRPMREQLMAYERQYFSTTERRERSAAQHEKIIDALEAGDHERASALVRENFTTALPGPNAVPDARPQE